MKVTRGHLGIVLVFAAGIALGAVGMKCWGIYRFKHRPLKWPRPTAEMLLDRLGNELDLSAEQREKIRPAAVDLHGKIQALRNETKPRILAIVEDARKEVGPNLDPSQNKKLEELLERLREGGPPGPPPGP